MYSDYDLVVRNQNLNLADLIKEIEQFTSLKKVKDK